MVAQNRLTRIKERVLANPIGFRLTAALSLSLLAATAQANLIQNGSFENTTAATTSTFLGQVANWSNSNIGEMIVLPSWFTNGYLVPGVGVAGPLPQSSPDGGNFVFSDGDFMNSPITQLITGLTVNSIYQLTFYQALVQDTEVGITIPGPVSGFWQVSLGINIQNSAPMTANGATLTISPWALQTMTFTAQNTSELLTFFSIGTGDPPLLGLDGVSLTEVPEPGSLALFALTVLIAGTVYRRTRWRRIAG